MDNLRGKVALVTGASRGIGREIAKELASLGASVVVNYSKDEAGAIYTIESIREEGGYAICLQGDVSSYDDALRMIDEVMKKFGKIDILINNAGISKTGLFMDFTKEDLDSVLDVNLKGTINVTHCAIKNLINSRNPVIVNVSSIWGNVGASCEVLYSVSKGGINLFTKSLAKEVAPWGIRVNAVAPGVIDTNMNNWLSECEREELCNEIPMGRFGKTSEIAKTVAFLCSEDSSYMTGQILTIDGGML